MKKVSVFLACLLTISLLVACQTTPQITEPSTEPSTQPATTEPKPTETEPPQTESTEPSEEPKEVYAPEELSDDYVVDLYRVTYTNDYGEYTEAIPYVNLPGEAIRALNGEIQAVCQYDPGDRLLPPPTIARFDYTWHTNGDILTLIMVEEYTSYEYYYYHIYNIDLRSNRPMTEEELFQAAGITAEEFNLHFPNLTANALFKNLGPDGCEEYFGNLSHYDDLFVMFTDTTIEYRQYAQPYLNEEGELYFAASISSPAGAIKAMQLLAYDPEAPRSPYYDICEAYLEIWEGKNP